MIKFRWWVTQRAVKEELTGRGSEEVGAADDFSDLHRGVIHHNGELIGWNVVVTPDDEISEISSSY